jgi:hypothetical protein
MDVVEIGLVCHASAPKWTHPARKPVTDCRNDPQEVVRQSAFQPVSFAVAGVNRPGFPLRCLARATPSTVGL